MKPPPTLEKTEKAVLSVILQREKGWDETLLDESLFYSEAHKQIFRLSQEVDHAMDEVQLVEIGLKRGVLSEMGGAPSLLEIYHDYVPRGTFLKDVERLRLCAARRLAIKAARQIEESAYDLGDDTFLEHLGEPITNVIEVASASAPEKSTKQVFQDVLADFKSLLEGKTQAMGWEVSLPSLTAALRGFCANRVCVVSGYPSSGKTLLVGQFLVDLAKQGVPSMLMSFEMPRDQLGKRLIVTNGRFDPEVIYDPIRNGQRQGRDKPSKADLLKVKESYRQITDSPLYLDEATGPTIDQVCAMIRRAHRKHGVIAFGIDYLQLIRSPGAGSKEQELTTISHKLQAIMKELGLLIFLLSQQNKDGDTKYATTTIEDADYVLSIQQVMDKESVDFKKVTGITINKDRHTGRSGWTFPIERHPDTLYFKETPFQK